MTSSDTAMAAVAPMLVNSNPHHLHHGNQDAFSHHHLGSMGRRGSSDSAFPHSSSHSSVMNKETKEKRQLTSLEDLAARIEEQTLREDIDSAAFSYLDNKLHGGSSDIYTCLPKKSRSLPSSYYRTSDKSSDTPKAPLRKVKSVKFADTFGLPLAKTVLQLTNNDSSYTANKIVPYVEEDLLCKSPLIIGSQKSESSSTSSSSEDLNSEAGPPSKYVLHQGPTSPTYTATHKHTFSFTIPSLEPDFLMRVERERVVLESAREEPRTLHGIIRVANLSYEKEVVVRWTHDNWRTSHDTVCVFCSNDGSTDRFAFELPINGDDVSFAIRYRVSGKDYWDNNHGANYTVFSRPLTL